MAIKKQEVDSVASIVAEAIKAATSEDGMDELYDKFANIDYASVYWDFQNNTFTDKPYFGRTIYFTNMKFYGTRSDFPSYIKAKMSRERRKLIAMASATNVDDALVAAKLRSHNHRLMAAFDGYIHPSIITEDDWKQLVANKLSDTYGIGNLTVLETQQWKLKQDELNAEIVDIIISDAHNILTHLSEEQAKSYRMNPMSVFRILNAAISTSMRQLQRLFHTGYCLLSPAFKTGDYVYTVEERKEFLIFLSKLKYKLSSDIEGDTVGTLVQVSKLVFPDIKFELNVNFCKDASGNLKYANEFLESITFVDYGPKLDEDGCFSWRGNPSPVILKRYFELGQEVFMPRVVKEIRRAQITTAVANGAFNFNDYSTVLDEQPELDMNFGDNENVIKMKRAFEFHTELI